MDKHVSVRSMITLVPVKTSYPATFHTLRFQEHLANEKRETFMQPREMKQTTETEHGAVKPRLTDDRQAFYPPPSRR